MNETPPPGSLWFRCNICGQDNVGDLSSFGREVSTCLSCRSTGRERAIIRALSVELFGETIVLADFPQRRDIVGTGMSDSGRYATQLAEKFRYQNTFYHQEPRLDITMTVPPALAESHDFVISSEVFEHIAPPVQLAFDNVFKILRPGGTFVLTVPYGLIPKTIEHFPSLNTFHVEERNGSYVLQNVARDGTVEEFHDLVFHVGDGATVEMRVFGENDLVQHCSRAGFKEIKVHRAPDFAHGIWWPEPWSFPISAKKPLPS